MLIETKDGRQIWLEFDNLVDSVSLHYGGDGLGGSVEAHVRCKMQITTDDGESAKQDVSLEVPVVMLKLLVTSIEQHLAEERLCHSGFVDWLEDKAAAVEKHSKDFDKAISGLDLT